MLLARMTGYKATSDVKPLVEGTEEGGLMDMLGSNEHLIASLYHSKGRPQKKEEAGVAAESLTSPLPSSAESPLCPGDSEMDLVGLPCQRDKANRRTD